MESVSLEIVTIQEPIVDFLKIGNHHYNDDEQPNYFPPELVHDDSNELRMSYHCYLIELRQNFEYNIQVHDIVLATRSKLELDVESMEYDLEVDRGILTVKLQYAGEIDFCQEEVRCCRRFQTTLLCFLIEHNLSKVSEVIDESHIGVDYLLLPSANTHHQPALIDWRSIRSVLFILETTREDNINGSTMKGPSHVVQTKNGPVCTCMLLNSLVVTPHNGRVYCITGSLDELDANSLLMKRNGQAISYKEYYEERHGIKLSFEQQSLIKGRPSFPIQNNLHCCRKQKEKESTKEFVELPPELCFIIMSPISVNTIYSFSFIPSIMHRLEALLIAVNLKKMYFDNSTQNVSIPTIKLLEAITTKNCLEKINLESLETLGDSFLKYAVSQELFKANQNHQQGLLSNQKDKIISNATLCKLGCDRKISGFIRNKAFDPKRWIIPGAKYENYALEEELLFNTRKIYSTGRSYIKGKRVADVVEALIGAFLSTAGEMAAISFMDWLGIKISLCHVPYERHFQVHPKRFVNVRELEEILDYVFHDPSLLVEALTHGSYICPETLRSYERLEFLGDSVVDYLFTIYFYIKYPGMSPELLTDMRSASVNNECYALSAIKAGLHKHILHNSHKLDKDIAYVVDNFENLCPEETFGWESESEIYNKVLGDVIESLAGAIFVDSGYNKDKVFHSMRRLLEPLVTPETMKPHPGQELNTLCRKEDYKIKKPIKSFSNGVFSVTIEVEANGVIYKCTSTASNKDIAKKLASKKVLKSLKNTNCIKKPIKSFSNGVFSVTIEVEANCVIYKCTSTASE